MISAIIGDNGEPIPNGEYHKFVCRLLKVKYVEDRINLITAMKSFLGIFVLY